MTTAAVAESCLMCEQEDAPGENVVWRDELFACEVTPGYEVPGWIIVRVRRHAIGWPGLDDPELALVGRRFRDTVQAVQEVTGAEKAYVLMFGEAFPHFHALVVPRGSDVPPELRSAHIMTRRTTDIDVAASQALVPDLSAAYARLLTIDD